MDFRILGPMVVTTAGGSDVHLGGPKERAVLAVLLAARGRAVETDRLVEELWPDSVVSAGRKTVQSYVSRLGTRLAAEDGDRVIRALPAGYMIPTEDRTVDAETLESALVSASAAIKDDPDASARELESALSLWRGRPFEDVHPTPTLESEARRLEELRLVAFEAWVESSLAAGRHREVVAQLRKEASDNPLRESLWALLMLALYRSDRQAEALRAYADLGKHLADELGIEPSRDLVKLEEQILLQDPSLVTPRAEPAVLPPPRKRRVWLLAASAAAVTTIVAIALALLPASSIGDGPEPRIEARHSVPAGTSHIVAAGGRVWLLDPLKSTIGAFDPSDGSIIEYNLPAPPSAFASGPGAVWVASAEAGALIEVDAFSGSSRIVAEGLVLDGAALAVGRDAVWVIRERTRPFLRIDAVSFEVETLAFSDPVGGPAEPGLALHDGVLWVSNSYIGRILALDTSTGLFDFAGESAIGEHSARSILTDRGAVWFSQPTNGTVTKVDASTAEVVAITMIGRTSGAGFGRVVAPYALAAGPGGVWVALPRDGKVVLVDDETGAMVAELDFRRPTGLAITTRTVWVLDEGAGELVAVSPETCVPIPFIGPGADLRGCDLSSKILVGVDLTGSDLRWADLSRATIGSVDLSDADLFGAELAPDLLDSVTWSVTRCPDGSLSERHGGECPSRRGGWGLGPGSASLQPIAAPMQGRRGMFVSVLAEQGGAT